MEETIRQKGDVGVNEQKKTEKELDWELSDAFYKENEGGERTLSLEDFIEEEPDAKMYSVKGELEKTVEDVRKVQKLSAEGKTIDEIAAETGMDRAYVYNIQVCAQGFHEDDEIAVAHLVMMG